MTGWKVVVIGLIAALPAVPLSFVVWDFATYNSAGWRRDYEHLKRELAQNYANLDWIVAHRHLDLAELDARTSEAIDNAHSRIGAFLALQDFIGSFQDPHLRIHWWRQDTDAQAEPVASSCAAVGYLQEDTVFNLPLDLWPSGTKYRPHLLSREWQVILGSFALRTFVKQAILMLVLWLSARDFWRESCSLRHAHISR